MKKKALRKDFYMEIRKSLGRFLSIFFIVMLGVAFFSGIRATEPDMRYTGDAYSDKYQLMDIQVISTLGLTEEDAKALKKVERISKVEAGYSSDVLCENNDSQEVLHVMSMLPTMNQVEVQEGRLPEAYDECFVDEDFLENGDYKVGDRITFQSGTKDAVTDTFRTDTFTIVGSGNSACYISIYRGSSTIGNGSVKGFVYVPEDSFVMDVYTEIYAQVEGAEGLTAFTEAYEDRVGEVLDRVEDIREERQNARYYEIVDEANEKLSDAKGELSDAKEKAETELSDAKAELDSGWKQLQDGKQQIEDGRQAIRSAKTELVSQQKILDEKSQELNQGLETVKSNQEMLNQKKTELESGQEQLDQQWKDYEAMKSSLETGITELETQLAVQKSNYENLLASGSADPDMLEMLRQAIEGIEDQLSDLRTQQTALEQGRVQLQSAQEELDQGKAQIQEAQSALDAALLEIQDGQAQLAQGQSKIDAGWGEISANEAKLSGSAAEITANEQKLTDAQAEYEEGKAEADEKIADGEQKIRDAEDEISKIEHAKWYINDRSALTEYNGYGENADRIRAIGEVFPVLFFLVAALISLTTMTRMVEEQRIQIGTLKALGYSRGLIAAKYLGYAFLATVGGSILGILIGEKFLPYIIIVAYGIMYPHMDTIRLPYEWYYAVWATVIAAICTVGAAWSACNKELKGTAAELMRPPAPKIGKRVFLERITFIWKRLNFIWKATIRNLFRYKKRFFMTISGISGCMALLMVGFGLEDSISNIARLQYGEIQCYDANLILNTSAELSEQEEAVEALSEDPRVEELQKTLMEKVKVTNGKNQLDVYLNIPENVKKYENFVTFRDRIGKEKYELDEEGVILTEKAASMLDVERGDTIVIQDDIQGEVEVKITHICENYMGHYLYMTPDFYEKTLKRTPEYNAVCFRMKAENANELEAVGEQVLTREGALSISYMSEIQGQVDSMLTSLDSVLGVIIMFAGMLAFVVLYNLNNINITERRRELATLKVLGFYDVEVAEYVYRENVLLTLIGAAVGCFLGYILHRFVIVTVEIDTVMFGRNIDFSSYVLSILITIGFSCFVNWIMYYKLKKIDMVESLKSVE